MGTADSGSFADADPETVRIIQNMRNILKRTIILAFVLLSASCSTFAKPIKIEYMILTGFTGGVIVLYNQPDGIKPEILPDGTVRYLIPKDGFLKVNTPEPEAIYDYVFYYVDEKNNQTPIEYIEPHGSTALERGDSRSVDTITEEERNTKVFAMNHRSIGFEANGNKGPLIAFSVGLPKDSRSIYLKTLDKYDEISKERTKTLPKKWQKGN